MTRPGPASSVELLPSEILVDALGVRQRWRWRGTILPETPSASKTLFVLVALELALF